MNETRHEALAVIAAPGRERRQGGQALYSAAEELVRAFHEARVLSDELLARFERIDEARRLLEPLGLLTAVEFVPEIQAALTKWRAAGRDVFDVPDFLRVPAEER